jgi:protein arginine N-methyltransferase 6
MEGKHLLEEKDSLGSFAKRRKFISPEEDEKDYFQAYAHIGIHEEMLKDFVRTNAYKEAIFRNSDLIQNKVVLDIGCGTAILSIFCAQAGAKKVYAIDASDIADTAIKIVAANNLSDKIEVHKGKLEEIELPEKVDIIVSEWMGYFLIYEAMLKTVLYGRDKWLKPDGILLPSEARMYIALYCDEEYYESKINFWKNVYGVNMSPMIPLAKQFAFSPPTAVDTIQGEALISEGVEIKRFDCKTVKIKELEILRTPFKFTVSRTCDWQGFVGWFDVLFPGRGTDPNTPVCLTTAPGAPYTHWHQTLFVFEDPIPVREGDILAGFVTVQNHPQGHRHLSIVLEFSIGGQQITRCFEL